MNIREIYAQDMPRISEIVQAVGNFSEEENETAMELAREALDDAEASGYYAYVLEDDGVVQGYVCYGPVPLTDGTYDLYWIFVDPNTQGKGFGKALMEFTENDVRSRGGRFLVIETSSTEAYGPTIRFYEKMRYTLAATLKDYYRPGDDKLIFMKKL